MGIVGSQRKRTEEALSKGEERFRALTESTSDWIWEVDKNGVYTYASPKIKELLGYEPEEIFGKTPFDLMPPEEAKRVAAEFKAVAATRKPFNRLKNANLHKNGRIVVLETSGVPIFDANGNFQGYRGIDRDITEHEKAEKRLRLLSSVVEQSSEGLAVSDLKGDLLFVNDAFAAMHGYSPEKLVGRHLSIFHTPEQMPSVNEANQQMQKTGEFNGEIWHVRRDGTVFPALMHNSLLRDEAGNPIGMIGSLRDISEHKKLERQRLESNRRLQRLAQKLTIAHDDLKVAIETRGEFMNIAAHELRTPLQPIIGYTDRLLREGKPTDWQKERLKIISDNAKHLLKLIQDILDINKMETGIMKFTMKETDLLAIIKKIHESFKPIVEAKKLKFILDIPKTLGSIKVKGDPNRLNQVFSNLIDNAVKFTEQGSISINLTEDAKTATINIKDTGIGIAKKNMPRVFTKFFQVDGTDKRIQGGTGLGLTVCKEIVKAHKGKITAQSILGKGSTFAVVLPKLETPANGEGGEKWPKS